MGNRMPSERKNHCCIFTHVIESLKAFNTFSLPCF